MKWSKLRPHMLLDVSHWKRWLYTRRDGALHRMNWEAELDLCVPFSVGPGTSAPSAGPGAPSRLRILYVAPKFDYGDPRRGVSFEESNFFHTFWSLGHEVFRFDYFELIRRFGRRTMNRMLLEAAYRYAPDLMFVVLFEEELDGRVVREISTQSPTVTLNWFCDDQWRFEGFSCRWAPEFDWVVTTSEACLPRYRQAGCGNVIRSQWACNHFLYRKLELPMLYDVSFVGQPHGHRSRTIETLRRAGISVHTWGYGWKAGRVSQMEMVKIFNQSRINLNLSKSSTLTQDQIKGRDFEIPGCGGFLMTGGCEELKDYFEAGKDVVCYHDVNHLIELIRYYLRNEDEREAIARAGHCRVIREHTYERRFRNIFEQVGIGHPAESLVGR